MKIKLYDNDSSDNEENYSYHNMTVVAMTTMMIWTQNAFFVGVFIQKTRVESNGCNAEDVTDGHMNTVGLMQTFFANTVKCF